MIKPTHVRCIGLDGLIKHKGILTVGKIYQILISCEVGGIGVRSDCGRHLVWEGNLVRFHYIHPSVKNPK